MHFFLPLYCLGFNLWIYELCEAGINKELKIKFTFGIFFYRFMARLGLKGKTFVFKRLL